MYIDVRANQILDSKFNCTVSCSGLKHALPSVLSDAVMARQWEIVWTAQFIPKIQAVAV